MSSSVASPAHLDQIAKYCVDHGIEITHVSITSPPLTTWSQSQSWPIDYVSEKSAVESAAKSAGHKEMAALTKLLPLEAVESQQKIVPVEKTMSAKIEEGRGFEMDFEEL